MYNGHEYVDLGLPSGTKWATCNVGANTPEGCGNKYAFGEITTKSIYGDDFWYRKFPESKYSPKYKYTRNLHKLPSTADAATVNWGAGWRMPTEIQFEELIKKCIRKFTKQNGVFGCSFTGPNGNSIFLPAAGYRDGSDFYGAFSDGSYWSSTLKKKDCAIRLLFFEREIITEYDYVIRRECKATITSNVYWGCSVRPVLSSE